MKRRYESQIASHKPGACKGFTLIELLVAVGIMAMVLSFAAVIFRVCVGSHRTAIANAEIMQKLRAITDQLNADFRGLRKDGEIFVVWVAAAKVGEDLTDPNSYERFDRIMFFADGDFQSYGVNHKVVRGNVARVCYTLANRLGDPPLKAHNQKPEKRILARTQHIFTDDDAFVDVFDGTFVRTDWDKWYDWNNRLEYDRTSLEEWKVILYEGDMPAKVDMLSVIGDVKFLTTTEDGLLIGSVIEPSEPNSVHMLLCEGVGQFEVQGWYETGRRWVPELDPDGDGDLSDTEFFLDGSDDRVPGVLYPYRGFLSPFYGFVSIGGEFDGELFQELLNEERFNEIPGLGRALKFTFTLYDSKGVIKDGRTFTHIVYLDN